jgi:DNA repair protein RecO (recombination protein O)
MWMPQMTNSRREQVYRTEAIVIGRLNLGEADRILTLFTPSGGKYRVIAKGIRRPQSRKAPHLELFSRSQIMLAKGRDLDVITSAEVIEPHWPLRTDLDAFGQASYLAELLVQFTEDRQENRRAYELLNQSLTLLAEGANPFAVTRFYELALMTAMGFRPELYACINCDRKIEAEPNGISARLGGLLCPACRQMDFSAQILSVNAQKYIRLLDRSGLSGALPVSLDGATAAEVERALTAYARFHAERETRSLPVIKSIREWRPDYDAPTERGGPG